MAVNIRDLLKNMDKETVISKVQNSMEFIQDYAKEMDL